MACADDDWQRAVAALEARKASTGTRMALSIYPWDIVTEIETRLESPQAMLLVVPNGKVKLLNALPFAPADLRRDSLETAWRAYRDAWRTPEVRAFVGRCRADPALLDPCQRDVGDGVDALILPGGIRLGAARGPPSAAPLTQVTASPGGGADAWAV